MKITELKPGQEITIRCKRKDLIADVKANIAQVRGENLLLDLIRHDGKVVDFNSPNVDLIVIYEDGLDLPKAWTKCKIKRMKVDGKQYHVLATPRVSVRINRRKVSRVTLDIPGVLQVSDGKQDIVIHDLSGIGIGIQTPKKIEVQDYKHLRIHFIHEIPGDEDEDPDEERINVEAGVVWHKELENGQFYYGCRLTHAEENLGYYIAAKMEEEKEREAEGQS